MKGEPSPGALEIDCVRRDERGTVTHVGGPGGDGRRWMLPLAQAIAALERNEARYFVSRGPQQLGLRVKNGELITMLGEGWSVQSLPGLPPGG